MAVSVGLKDHLLNTAGAAEMYLALADVGAGRYLMVWASYIVWDISGNISRMYLEDGVGEYDLVQIYDTGVGINPRHFLWTLGVVPSKMDPGARVVVQFGGTADRRIICAGYNLAGVDLASPLGTIASDNDQTNTQKLTSVIVPNDVGAGTIFDLVSCLRGGSVTKPDYVPQTAGLVEQFDTVPFPSSLFYGAAGGTKEDGGSLPLELSWLVSPDFDTAWNHTGVMVRAELDVPPVSQAITLHADDEQTLTLREE